MEPGISMSLAMVTSPRIDGTSERLMICDAAPSAAAPGTFVWFWSLQSAWHSELFGLTLAVECEDGLPLSVRDAKDPVTPAGISHEIDRFHMVDATGEMTGSALEVTDHDLHSPVMVVVRHTKQL